MRAFLKLALLALAASHLAATTAAAQSTMATVFGTVYDEQRGVLPDTTVLMTSLDTGQPSRTTTGRTGNFRIWLAPGRYELRASRPGFADVVRRDLVLTISQEFEIILTMKVGSVTDSVTVVAESSGGSPLIAPGRTITTQQIDDLPVASRDFISLALLTPGIVSDRSTGRNPNVSIATSGQNARNNTFLVDGVSLDEHFGALTRGSVSLDAVKEFKVLSNNYSAEYGQASGAIVAVLTRSGTNQTAGRASYYRRDDRWDATDAAVGLLDPLEVKPVLRGGDAGGFLGGALVSDRAFYFGSAERTARDTEDLVTSPELHVFRPGAPTHLPVLYRDAQVFGRADINATSRDTVTLRYRLDRVFQTNQVNDGGLRGFIAPERRADVTRRDQDVSAQINRVLGMTAFNELRFQFAERIADTDATRYCPSCPAENRPGILLGKAPVVPAHRRETRYQFVETMSWIVPDRAGDHSFKTGLDVSVIGGESLGSSGQDGIWMFNSNAPSASPTRYTVFVGDPSSHLSSRLYTVFAQDDWKPASRLTMNLGARWDYEDAIGASEDRNNLAPRIGVAFDPWNTGRTTVRGGYGVFYDSVLYRALNNSATGSQVTQFQYQNPGYPCLGEILTVCRLTAADLAGLAPAPPSTNRFADDIKSPYTEQATAGVRHVAGRFMLTADGVWSRGRNLLRTRDINYPNLDDPLRPRPNPSFGRIRVRETEGHSWYRALLVGVNTRQTRRYSYGVAYTLARSERDTEDWEFIAQDQRDYAAERGPASNDVRHGLVANVNADLPWGIRVAGILTAHSALPYTITTGVDTNGDTEISTDRPDGLGRNSARGDSFWQLDLRLSRQFRVKGLRMDLLADAFNLTNNDNWTEFDGNRRNATYGKHTSAASPREVQVGIRVSF